MQSEWKVTRLVGSPVEEEDTLLSPKGNVVRRRRIQRASLAVRVEREKARSMAKKLKLAGPQRERK